MPASASDLEMPFNVHALVQDADDLYAASNLSVEQKMRSDGALAISGPKPVDRLSGQWPCRQFVRRRVK